MHISAEQFIWSRFSFVNLKFVISINVRTKVFYTCKWSKWNYLPYNSLFWELIDNTYGFWHFHQNTNQITYNSGGKNILEKLLLPWRTYASHKRYFSLSGTSPQHISFKIEASFQFYSDKGNTNWSGRVKDSSIWENWLSYCESIKERPNDASKNV